MTYSGLFILLAAILAGIFGDDEGPPPDPAVAPVESAQRALEARSPLPWYNDEQDRLVPLPVESDPDDENRRSRWAVKEESQEQEADESSSDGSLVWGLLEAAAWTLLAVIVGLLIWALVWAASRGRFPSTAGEEVSTRQPTKARIEDLPMPVDDEHGEQGDFWAAARKHAEQGDWARAIIYAFAHQLVELDKNHLIRLTKGKTNRQYLRELRSHPKLVELVRPTMLAYEEVFFGHHPVSRQRFSACWENLKRFQQHMEQMAS